VGQAEALELLMIFGYSLSKGLHLSMTKTQKPIDRLNFHFAKRFQTDRLG